MKPILTAFLASSILAAAAPIQLFNGKDLTGWKPDVPQADKEPGTPPSFIVRDGLLVSLGTPLGHLITDESYADYKLTSNTASPAKPATAACSSMSRSPAFAAICFPNPWRCR